MMIPKKLLSMLSFVLAAAASAEASRRPNIILIISDDHTYSHYGFMGHELVRTPHLDRMASESLLYTRGYTMPVCSPSLASLLTGKLPHQHGITGNDLSAGSRGNEDNHSNRNALREHLLGKNMMILPKALSDAGYLTFQTGKLWNASFRDMGFTHGMTARRSRHGGEGLSIGREGMEPVFEFIRMASQEAKPFFVWYAPFLPHEPHNPPAEILANYEGKGPTPHAEVYYAMIEWFDRTCGELDGFLEANELKNNTAILYLADNGWDPLKGTRGGRAKLTPYENGIRTPVFLRLPQKVEPLRDDKSLASVLDIAPTILTLAGADVPPELPGIPLMDRQAMAARQAVFIESFTHDITELGKPQLDLMARVVISGWSKLILPGPVRSSRPFAKIAGEVELYDLQTDPGETRNLADQRHAEVARLRILQDAGWKGD